MSSSMQIIEYGFVDEAQLPYDNPRYLGSGHSGAVHAVQARDTKALYAQKSLRISGYPRGNTKETFLNEVRIISGLASHRHIVRIHATYFSTRHFGILLEPVASDGDLDAYLTEFYCQRDGKLLSTDLADMASVLHRGFGCLAAGMAFMHEKSVRHKDIKPSNILVHHGILLYTDFGYAWDSSGLDTSMTEGPPSGITRKFSAPEVLESEKRNSKSDVYSLGCVFIIILSALIPTLAFDSRQNFSDIMDGIHTELGSLKLPNELTALPAIITAMTDREPSSRLCAAHATCHLLQQPNLCCSQCASSENKDWTTLRKDDTCVPPVAIRTIGMSQQGFISDLDPLVSTSGKIAHEHGSARQFQDALGPPAPQYIDSRNHNNLLRPGDAHAEYSTNLVPSLLTAGYKVRRGSEAAAFFVQGRVFSVLQSEAPSPRNLPGDTVSVDRGLNRAWGSQAAQSVARRFIVVKARKRQQFIYAWSVPKAIARLDQIN